MGASVPLPGECSPDSSGIDSCTAGRVAIQRVPEGGAIFPSGITRAAKLDENGLKRVEDCTPSGAEAVTGSGTVPFPSEYVIGSNVDNTPLLRLLTYHIIAMTIKTKARPPIMMPIFTPVETVVVREFSCEGGLVPTGGPVELEIPDAEFGILLDENEDEEGSVENPVLPDKSDADIEDDDPLADMPATDVGVTVVVVRAVVPNSTGTPGATFCLGLPSLKLMAFV